MATTAVGTKWVYLFEEGNKDMRDLLGGKGAGVAEMTRAGLPVPPGFTITTECCNAYYQEDAFPEGMWEQVMEALAHLEEKTGKKFGDPERPLLVSVRSGAAVCRILASEGFLAVQTRGSHCVMQKKMEETTITVPVPLRDTVRIGTLQSIIRQSGLPRSLFETE